MRRRPPSLRRSLIVATAGPLAFGAVVTAVLVIGPDTSPTEMRVRQAPGPVETLIAEHDCYAGESPNPGVIPAGAVVSLPNQQARFVRSQVGFDIWEGVRPGTLHAFCLAGPQE